VCSRDIGFLPVCDGDHLVGVVTDRDIVLSSTAEGTKPNTSIGRDLMTSPIIYCFDDQDLQKAAKLMEGHQIRRVAVVSHNEKRLVGVVSLGDIATGGTKKLLQKFCRAFLSRQAKKTIPIGKTFRLHC
jgi:CBS domain-containing protein